MGIAWIGGFFCLRFKCHFLGIPSFKILRFRKMFFFLIQVLRYHRKMCRLCPSIPIFRGDFWLKGVKKCVCVLVLKFALLLGENVCFGMNKV